MRITYLNRQIERNPSSASTDSVIFQQENYMAKVILNKPKALNALDMTMIRSLQNKIQSWTESNVKAVWICGAGGKAFCAGGDIRSLYDTKIAGKIEDQKLYSVFFGEEFALDYNLAVMKPTQISVMDGIVMGGGVGISVHAPIKIATENSIFAMPEARLGFFTDVGGGYFLSRLRNKIGLYLALTGARLKGKELVQTGIANYYVPRASLDSLESEIKKNLKSNTTTDDIKAIVAKYAEAVPSDFKQEEEIKKLFQGDSLEKVLENINSSNSELARSLQKSLKEQNSISLKVIFEQIKRGSKMDLRENFLSDFRISQRFCQKSDFFEGIRSVLIDKSSSPNWTYKTPQEVPDSEVQAYFLPLPQNEELKI